MKKIYFRADAGADIGYGHFIRSLSLASILKDKFECALFTKCKWGNLNNRNRR